MNFGLHGGIKPERSKIPGFCKRRVGSVHTSWEKSEISRRVSKSTQRNANVERREREWNKLYLHKSAKINVWAYNFLGKLTKKKKWLISKIYKEISKLKIIKANNPSRKWIKDVKRHLTKYDTWLDNEHVRRCLTSLAIREMQMKTLHLSEELK